VKQFAYDFEKPALELRERLAALEREVEAAPDSAAARAERAALEKELDTRLRDLHARLTPWQKVLLARHPLRPRGKDFIDALFTDFTPLLPDRRGLKDPALITGIARFEEWTVAVCATDRGHDARENVRTNFGMVHPEGYYAAIELMERAERFGIPFVSIVDTPGAHPGPEAEERGQAWAISAAIEKMLWLSVPSVAVLSGEGGSGGALALACSDRRIMLEHAYFSVISPEGCASILWRDEAHAEEAAAALKLTAQDLLAFGFVDAIVPEPLLAAHWNPAETYAAVREHLRSALAEVTAIDASSLLEERHAFFDRVASVGQRG
jgi:acetyl-CoA carboxylase carboxyl transferase subunit alpha